MIIHKRGEPILTIEDWYRLAPPKEADQWADDRSAKEAARAWLTGVPDEVSALLSSHPEIVDLVLERAEPEALLAFDSRSGPCNADIALTGRDRHGVVALAVEAKADETFGKTVADTFDAALERLIKKPRSGGVARLAELAQSLLPPRAPLTAKAVRLRYQLLTGVAGVLAHAITLDTDRAVFLVHEFRTRRTSLRRLSANQADLDRFVARVTRGGTSAVQPGRLYGPFAVPGKPLFTKPIRLYIGKATRTLGTPNP